MLRTAKVAQQYAGKEYKPGDQFEVEQDHIALLIYLDRIELEPGETGYLSKDCKTDHMATVPVEPFQPKQPKRAVRPRVARKAAA